jgi:hypothetical protein
VSVCTNEQDVSSIYSLQVTLVGSTSSLEILISLYSFPMGRLLFSGVFPLFNGLPWTSGIFFSSKKGYLGGKYLPQLPKHKHSLLARDVSFHDVFI